MHNTPFGDEYVKDSVKLLFIINKPIYIVKFLSESHLIVVKFMEYNPLITMSKNFALSGMVAVRLPWTGQIDQWLG